MLKFQKFELFMNTLFRFRIAPNVGLNTLCLVSEQIEICFEHFTIGMLLYCWVGVELYCTLFGKLSLATYMDCGLQICHWRGECNGRHPPVTILCSNSFSLFVIIIILAIINSCHSGNHGKLWQYLTTPGILSQLSQGDWCTNISPEGDKFHSITLSFHPILTTLVGQASLISSHFYQISTRSQLYWTVWNLSEIDMIREEFPRFRSIIGQWTRHH